METQRHLCVETADWDRVLPESHYENPSLFHVSYRVTISALLPWLWRLVFDTSLFFLLPLTISASQCGDLWLMIFAHIFPFSMSHYLLLVSIRCNLLESIPRHSKLNAVWSQNLVIWVFSYCAFKGLCDVGSQDSRRSATVESWTIKFHRCHIKSYTTIHPVAVLLCRQFDRLKNIPYTGSAKLTDRLCWKRTFGIESNELSAETAIGSLNLRWRSLLAQLDTVAQHRAPNHFYFARRAKFASAALNKIVPFARLLWRKS